MDIKPIRTKADYKAALKTVSRLVALDPARGTADGDKLDILATLVQAYEAEHFPMSPADPIEAIKFRMESEGGASLDRARTYRVARRLTHSR